MRNQVAFSDALGKLVYPLTDLEMKMLGGGSSLSSMKFRQSPAASFALLARLSRPSLE